MSRHSSYYYSPTQVGVLCIFCFFLGRFLQLPGMPDAGGKGPTIVKAERKMLLQTKVDRAITTTPKSVNNQQQQPSGNTAIAANPPSFTTFEEVIDASGLLAHKPAIASGETGMKNYMVQPFQILSWHPRAYLFPSFMDKEKCEHVISLAKKRLAPSGLALKKGDTIDGTKDVRTSQGTFIARGDDPGGVLAWVEEKIAALSMLPVGHGEAFNVLRYENGAHYDSHYDAFDEAEYGPQSSQRIATVLVYLSDVEEGGETVFLFEGQGGLERLKTVDYKACNTGINYKPRQGDALLFWSMHPNMTLDKHALHGSCPVTKGEKWVMTKWIREQCMWGDAFCQGR